MDKGRLRSNIYLANLAFPSEVTLITLEWRRRRPWEDRVGQSGVGVNGVLLWRLQLSSCLLPVVPPGFIIEFVH